MLPAGSHAGRRNLASIRVSTAHTCRTCHLCPLCVWCSLGWAAAGWRLAESLPSSQPAAAAAGLSAAQTPTLTKPFEKTLKQINICTWNFTYQFALTYSHISNARPLSPLHAARCLSSAPRMRTLRGPQGAGSGSGPRYANVRGDRTGLSRHNIAGPRARPRHVRGSRYAHHHYDGVTVTLCMLSLEANVQQWISRYEYLLYVDNMKLRIRYDITMKHTNSM